MEKNIPSLSDVLDAKRRIKAYLPRTPLIKYDSLGDIVSAQVYVKHENHLPTNAFKVRGGINLISRLSDSEKSRGVISASTGNHAQSIAYASRIFGAKATIIMPISANPLKVEATKRLGANVVQFGKDFDESREYAEKTANEQNIRYVHSANEPELIAGVATLSLEIFEDLPDVDAIILPVGGGSMASGACIVASSMNSTTKVIGVQAAAAPAAYRSWKEGKLVSDKMGTFAEGLATRVGFELTQEILRSHLDDFVLVSDDEIRRAILLLIEKTHNLVEAAGAAPLAALIKSQEKLKGKKVAIVTSGANISTAQLKELLS
ncbi:MAG TPA: threonine/serine dehydratase [Nitrososphaerales archaeon]|nr:threonine/serine dehydratase [Nitrososphaerales archaeon]